MPNVISNSILSHKGKIYRHGEELTLDAETIEALGTKVLPPEAVDPEKPLSELPLKELRPLAKAAGVENYSKKGKDDLVAELEAATKEAVNAYESNSD